MRKETQESCGRNVENGGGLGRGNKKQKHQSIPSVAVD